MAAEVLRARGLTRRYGPTTALQALDLTLEAGELRGLLGPNGAGKTTLLRAIFGLIQPDAGEITTAARPAGFVEDPTFYPYLSGRANLELIAALGETDPATIGPALERVGLADRAQDRVGGYSTGMRQRLGLAAALLGAPKLLLLDEPTSGMDPVSARATAGLLRELAREGVAVLVSSHQIGELETFCDTYTILRGGRIVWEGDREAVEAADPRPTYRLLTDDDDRALAAAGAVGGIAASRDPERGLRITGDRAARDDYLRVLGRAGIVPRQLERAGGALGELYLKVTG
jgi:ABC-2 type transport system ATP-binding protein